MLKIHLMMLSTLILCSTNNTKNWWILTASMITSTIMSLNMMTSSLTLLSPSSAIDQLSQPLIILTSLITALMLITSTKIIHNKNMHKLFMLMNISLMYILMSCFSTSNIFMFYILFEASLIPTMIIIMLWGYQPERVQASMYMMMYTIMASLPMLLMFFLMYKWSLTMNMNLSSMFMPHTNHMISLLLISGFLVKLPMFSTHLWLPKAHVEAPIAGSMILAAILLKLGGYGIIRIVTNLPINLMNIQSILISISMIGAILTSMICLRQPDLKSLIAYSSVGHMGLMLAGAVSNTTWGLMGATMMMIAHGLSSSALFSMANLIYENSNTRSMFLMKGWMNIMPIMSLWWFLFAAANMAAPPSLNLLSEIMLITSISSMSIILIIPLMLITFLTGAYSLFMYSATQHGQVNNFTNPPSHIKQKDLLMLMMHLIPLILMIIKPEMMTSWI